MKPALLATSRASWSGVSLLKFCDPSTLAQTSRVSLAFLELTSPLLYIHVDIQGSEQLERMLVERDSSHQPQLSALLSLDQIKTLTFTEPRITVSSPVFPLRLDRFASSTHSLQRLSVFLPFTAHGLPVSGGHVFTRDLVSLRILDILHPVHLHVEGLPSRSADGAVIDRQGEFPPLLIALGRKINPNLRSLHLKNAMVNFNRIPSSLRDFVVEVSEDLGVDCSFFMRHVIWSNLLRDAPEVGGPEIAVRVGTEARKRVMLKDFRSRIEHDWVAGEVKERWLKQVEAAVRL